MLILYLQLKSKTYVYILKLKTTAKSSEIYENILLHTHINILLHITLFFYTLFLKLYSPALFMSKIINQSFKI